MRFARSLSITEHCAGPVALGLVLALSAAVTAVAQTRENEKQREQWLRIGDLVAVTAVGPGSAVADVGAGDGFLSMRLSPVVGPGGRVYAVEIDEQRLERLRKRAEDDGLQNVTAVRGDARDPHLPASALDAVVILNAYHEMPYYEEMLRHIHDALKPGGRLVIAEPSPSDPAASRAEQVKAHRLTGALVADELTHAGFVVIDRQDEFAKIPSGGRYSLVVARRP